MSVLTHRRTTHAHRRSRARRRPRLRRVLPGKTYLLTKKTNDDLFWLRPSPEVERVLLYLLILKALRYGILVHGFCFMSNHFHLLVTDLRGELPSFMREFLSESGKALKVELRTTRRIWSVERYSSIELLDLDAAERKLAYVLLNPMEAELTRPEEWPGLTSARFRDGVEIRAERPDQYFSKRYRPARVTLRLVPLESGFPDETLSELCGFYDYFLSNNPYTGDGAFNISSNDPSLPSPTPIQFIIDGGSCQAFSGFVRGDANNDDSVNVADAIYVLGLLFPTPPIPPSEVFCADAFDCNDDGQINIADAVSVLASLFGTPATPLPPPSSDGDPATNDCGVDPTTDSLDCATAPGGC